MLTSLACALLGLGWIYSLCENIELKMQIGDMVEPPPACEMVNEWVPYPYFCSNVACFAPSASPGVPAIRRLIWHAKNQVEGEFRRAFDKWLEFPDPEKPVSIELQMPFGTLIIKIEKKSLVMLQAVADNMTHVAQRVGLSTQYPRERMASLSSWQQQFRIANGGNESDLFP